MAARNTRSGVNNNVDPTNNASGLADLLTQIIANLNARRTNDGKVPLTLEMDVGETRGGEAANGLSWENFIIVVDSNELKNTRHGFIEMPDLFYMISTKGKEKGDRYIWGLVPEI
ncbi:hypothetical protein Tco_0784265 [Tanacetum coccineum]